MALYIRPDPKNELTSEEELALSSFRNEHLPGINHSELILSWYARKDALLADKMQPFADALYGHIVGRLEPSVILEKLKEVCTTAKSPHELRVPLWTFKHCDLPHNYRIPVTSPAHAYWLEEGAPEAVRTDLIHKLGLRGLLCTKVYDRYEDAFDYELLPTELLRIFNKTDVKERLALYFGGRHFTVSLSRQTNYEPTEGLYLHQEVITVNLNYYPSGLPEHIQKKVAKAAVKYKDYVTSLQPHANVQIMDGSEMWSPA